MNNLEFDGAMFESVMIGFKLNINSYILMLMWVEGLNDPSKPESTLIILYNILLNDKKEENISYIKKVVNF